MNKCPKCGRYSLDYFSAAQVARCLLCGYSQGVATRDDFFSLFPNGRRVTTEAEDTQARGSSAGTVAS